MNEKTLVSALKKILHRELPGAVIFKHADAYTAGIPDLSVTWRGKTTWLEVKYVAPTLHKRALQHQIMLGLERQGSAFYVIYREHDTLLIKPSELDCPNTKGVTEMGHSHTFVVSAIKGEWA
jgi:hypothetical protein